MQTDVAARDRLLSAAAQLLETGDRSFSTRAVCDLAGVKAPTLYHHFGNKQGLIDAVLQHGFTQYVGSPTMSADPVQDIRDGWDKHVEFGLAHPAFYALLYGDVQPGRPCAVTSPATDMLLELLDEAARQGRLRVPPAEAAAQILAANVGVTLSLISQPEDRGLSDRVREAALAAVLVAPKESRTGSPRATAAIALTAALDQDPNGLTPGELTLLRELLARLGADQS
jgi:AcrR family transcriptional regulator